MNNNLIKKNVFITGSSSGIGFGLAKKYLDQGYEVIICSKNIKKLNGRPLIDYSIKHALKFHDLYSENNIDISLSTDCEIIKSIAKDCGLESKYTRPKYLANDTVGKIEVLDHILKYEETRNNKRSSAFNKLQGMDILLNDPALLG